MAAKAFRTTELLYITLQHEYGHARLNSLGYFGKQYHYAQEAIMNSLSCFQASAWGLKTLSKGYMSNSDFYSSKIPNGSDINVNTVDLLDQVRNDRPKW